MTPPRRRNRDNEHLPRGLYRHRRADGWAYYWYDPRVGKQRPMSKSLRTEAEVIEAYKLIRAGLEAADTSELPTLIEQYLAEQGLRKSTETQERGYLRQLAERFHGRTLASIGHKHLAEMFEAKGWVTARSGERAKSIYSKFWAWSIGRGKAQDNPGATVWVAPSRVHGKKRSRLTLEQFQAIHERASGRLQVAMDLLLITLQRPQDIVRWRYRRDGSKGQLGIGGGRLFTRQGKTTAGVVFDLADWPELADVVKRSRSAHVSPYIVHRDNHAQSDERMTKLLSIEFRKVRDALIAEGVLAFDGPPAPLYECKALGTHRYEDMGWTDEAIQAVAAHKEVRTTRIYLDKRREEWKTVKRGGG